MNSWRQLFAVGRVGEPRAWPHLGGPDGHKLERPRAIRVPVPVLVELVEPIGEPRPERHGQLERLPAVAQIGLSLGGEVRDLVERPNLTPNAVPPLLSNRETQG